LVGGCDMNTEKTEFRVGDLVKVYRYKKNMVFCFIDDMVPYIGKIAKIVSISPPLLQFSTERVIISTERIITLAFLDESTGEFVPCYWNWHKSVLRYLKKSETQEYFWAII
jgi:hypothetical protein